METFDKLAVKMKSHVWCIVFFLALLIFWITAFSVSDKGGDIASWLSILFAVVVIVYMLIQGHEMRNLVEEGHRLMAEKAGTMADCQTCGDLKCLMKIPATLGQFEKCLKAEYIICG